MFSVLFEAHPRADARETYLGLARMLRPELEQVDGFVDNVRYASLTRPGWLLSLSGWRDEKSVVRWRTRASHHEVQAQGRAEVLLDYHLRVGQVTHDTRVPPGHVLREQRLDETETGDAIAVSLIDGVVPAELARAESALALAVGLGLAPAAPGLVAWDLFDAVLAKGNLLLMCCWRREASGAAADAPVTAPGASRFRKVRIIRDYAMHDRREAPQYHADVPAQRSRSHGRGA